ncbi:MAG: fasciclin domain-containing protein [Draconibacterium sp.]
MTIRKFIYYFTIALLPILSACSDNYVTEVYTDEELTISRYLERDENFSELLSAMKRTQYFNILALQGTYTLWAPNNDAFYRYYEKMGVSGLDQLDDATVTKLVATHIIGEKIPSVNFESGRLPYPLSEESLIMSFGTEGISSTKVNGISLGEIDMFRTNGVIHELNEVIAPADKTMAEVLQENADYSIFYEAMTATGIIDTLASRTERNRNRFTLLVESNDALAQAGINSYDDLKAAYSSTNDVTDPADSLNQFMRYHIITEDLTALEFKTWTYNTVLNYPINITVDDQIKLNAVSEGGELVFGTLNLNYVDVLAWNGIIQRMESILPVIDVQPQPVLFIGTSICLNSNELDAEKVIYGDDATPPWISSDAEVLQYLCTDVGDYVEFYSPYLFNVTYKIYYENSTYNPGRTIYGIYINDEMVGEPFVNEYQKVSLSSGQKGLYVGKVTLNASGQQRVKVKVEGSYLYPDDNFIRLKKIYFEPDI